MKLFKPLTDLRHNSMANLVNPLTGSPELRHSLPFSLALARP